MCSFLAVERRNGEGHALLHHFVLEHFSFKKNNSATPKLAFHCTHLLETRENLLSLAVVVHLQPLPKQALLSPGPQPVLPALLHPPQAARPQGLFSSCVALLPVKKGEKGGLFTFSFSLASGTSPQLDGEPLRTGIKP